MFLKITYVYMKWLETFAISFGCLCNVYIKWRLIFYIKWRHIISCGLSWQYLKFHDSQVPAPCVISRRWSMRKVKPPATAVETCISPSQSPTPRSMARRSRVNRYSPNPTWWRRHRWLSTSGERWRITTEIFYIAWLSLAMERCRFV